MAKLVFKALPGEQISRDQKSHSGGRTYYDPQTEESVIEIYPEGSKRETAEVLRHEIGHLKLHMPKYRSDTKQAILREQKLATLVPDELDVAFWEYGITGDRKALDKRVEELRTFWMRWGPYRRREFPQSKRDEWVELFEDMVLSRRREF